MSTLRPDWALLESTPGEESLAHLRSDITCVLLHLSQEPTLVAKWTAGIGQDSSQQQYQEYSQIGGYYISPLVILMSQDGFLLPWERQKVEKGPKYSNKTSRICRLRD